MTISHISYADQSRVNAENMLQEAERIREAEAAQAPLARLARGEVIDPDSLSDEELASLFPAFALVWKRMAHAVVVAEEEKEAASAAERAETRANRMLERALGLPKRGGNVRKGGDAKTVTA